MIEFFSGLVALLMWGVFGIFGWGEEMLLRLKGNDPAPVAEPGIVFSFKQAESLGFAPRELFLEVLDDLEPRFLRVIAYWDRIETEDGEFDFSELDFQMQEAAQRDIKITLIVGEKTPRWPECHYPAWFLSLTDKEEKERQILDYLAAVAERYRNHAGLEFWQLENEPFLAFGECPDFNAVFFKRKLKFFKELDTQPVVITASGELDSWLRAFIFGDQVGFSVYRRFFLGLPETVAVKFDYIGKVGFSYPLPPGFYRFKFYFYKLIFHKEAMVTEFQLEPWLNDSPVRVPLDRQFLEFDFEDLKEYLIYARKLGLPRVYFWGVEWWYWLRDNSHPEFLDYLQKNVFNQ